MCRSTYSAPKKKKKKRCGCAPSSAKHLILRHPSLNFISHSALSVLVVQRFACIPENSFVLSYIILYFTVGENVIHKRIIYCPLFSTIEMLQSLTIVFLGGIFIVS